MIIDAPLYVDTEGIWGIYLPVDRSQTDTKKFKRRKK